MIVVMRRRKIASEQTALERPDLPCMYLAHHESASVLFIIITIRLTVHNRPSSGTTANEFDTMHCVCQRVVLIYASMEMSHGTRVQSWS